MKGRKEISNIIDSFDVFISKNEKKESFTYRGKYSIEWIKAGKKVNIILGGMKVFDIAFEYEYDFSSENCLGKVYYITITEQ